jgi:serine phosphatase RsbU (regulator of sigma subunit)
MHNNDFYGFISIERALTE